MAQRRRALAFLLDRRLKLATVSGILTTRPELIAWADRTIPHLAVLTTKSYQVAPNPGYREPVVAEEAPGCYGNAVGLRNPGMEAGLRELQQLRRRHRLRALLNVSLSASSIADFVRLAGAFTPVADMLELNLSCPHAAAGYGAAIGSDPQTVASYLRAVRQATPRPLLVKLTPNVEDIGAIAAAAVRAGADGICAINTVGPRVFREPTTGAPVLSNPAGHRGGKSGEWIRTIALARMREVRAAVGPSVPVIGVGGISLGEHVRAMVEAGADAVGLGSALARVARQDLIPLYAAALCQDALEGTDGARHFLATEPLMRYRPLRLSEIRAVGPETALLELDGALPFRAGQYVFLFLPGVGEKPFSVLTGEPLRLLIRRRGPLSAAACALRPGDTVLIRGPYGAEAPLDSAPRGSLRALVVAGGTGMAVAAPLARELAASGAEVRIFLGVRREEELPLAALAPGEVPLEAAADRGRSGRVLDAAVRFLAAGDPDRTSCYLVGPQGFLRAGAAVLRRAGADPRRVHLSLETMSMCGVGLCGNCQCGGRLLCKEGTFLSLAFLEQHEPAWQAASVGAQAVAVAARS